MPQILSDGHWKFETFTQRMVTKEWRSVLLNEEDRMIFHGHCRQLVGKSLGAGVYEVGKMPLGDKKLFIKSKKS